MSRGIVQQVVSDGELSHLDDDGAWQERSTRMRCEFDMPDDSKPWTVGHRLMGVKRLPRHLDAIDVGYVAWQREQNAAGIAVKKGEIPMSWFIDFTQNVDRRCWGETPDTLTIRTRIYCYNLDRCLTSEDCGCMFATEHRCYQ